MNTRRAFTLIELLVIITIISILSTVLLISFQTTLVQVRNSERKSGLQESQKALELYHARYGLYPTTNDLYFTSAYSPSDGEYHPNDYIPGLVPEFLPSLPEEPNEGPSDNIACLEEGEVRTYIYRSDGEHYKLMSHCGPEGAMSSNDPFRDPNYPSHTWSVCSDDETCRNW